MSRKFPKRIYASGPKDTYACSVHNPRCNTLIFCGMCLLLSERRTIFEGKLQQAMAAVQVELGTDVGAVRLHCARTDKEFRANFAAGFFLGNKLENPTFSLGEVVEARLVRRQLLGTIAAAHQITRNSRA